MARHLYTLHSAQEEYEANDIITIVCGSIRTVTLYEDEDHADRYRFPIMEFTLDGEIA